MRLLFNYAFLADFLSGEKKYSKLLILKAEVVEMADTPS